jgi:acyl carrier protein phosphodiesterase
MNYLAHLFLSDDDDEFRLGNFLGDFVKGRHIARLDGRLRRGWERHREIDRFTDEHPCVREARGLVSAPRRRFAGILLDVFFDHFLAREWSRYSVEPLDAFTRRVYRSFLAYEGELPPRARRAITLMAGGDWLGSYREAAGVERALAGIALRLDPRRAGPLASGAVELRERHGELRRAFLQFFPEVMAHVGVPGRSRGYSIRSSSELDSLDLGERAPDTVQSTVQKSLRQVREWHAAPTSPVSPNTENTSGTT